MYEEMAMVFQRILSIGLEMGRAGSWVLSILQVPPSISIFGSTIYTGQVVTTVATLAIVYIGLDTIRRYFKVLVATGVGLAIVAFLAKFQTVGGLS